MEGKMLRIASFSSDCTWTCLPPIPVRSAAKETPRREKKPLPRERLFRDIVILVLAGRGALGTKDPSRWRGNVQHPGFARGLDSSVPIPQASRPYPAAPCSRNSNRTVCFPTVARLTPLYTLSQRLPVFSLPISHSFGDKTPFPYW